MSQNTLNVRLRNAIKTESEWKSTDPRLLKGEVVYSSDKNLYKVGDGTSKWSELSYNSAESVAKINISLVTPTEEKIYYMPFHAGVTTNTRSLLDNDSLKMALLQGTTTTQGYNILMLGNSTTSGTAGNVTGYLRLYGKDSHFIQLHPQNPTADRYITFPDAGGTLLTTDTYSKYAVPITSGIQVYNRTNMGTAYNLDNPGVNGFFEVRHSSEVPNATGAKPSEGFYGLLNLKTSDNTAMLQLAGTNYHGFYIRGKQIGAVTLTDVPWLALLTSDNYNYYALPLSGGTMTGSIALPTGSSASTADGIIFGDNLVRIGSNTSGGVGIYASDTIYLRPGDGKISSSYGIAIDTASLTPKTPITLGTSTNKWSTVYANVFNGNLEGNASTATTLVGLNSTVAELNYSKGVTSNIQTQLDSKVPRRYCYVGQSSNTTTKPWYKFASIKLDAAYNDREITFKVSTGYATGKKLSGILRAQVRVGANITVESATLYWEYANVDINPANFVLACPTTASPTVELWVKCDTTYLGYHFDVLSEHSRTPGHLQWTLYNSHTAGYADAITSGYTQVSSTLLGIRNNAESASKITVTNTNPASSTTYVPVFCTGAGTSELRANNGFCYLTREGTTSQVGLAVLRLGNSIASGTAGNKAATLQLYSTDVGYGEISQQATKEYISHVLPPVSGTILNTGNYSSYAVVNKYNCSGTMNDAAKFGNSMGMINLSDPSDGTASYVNPNGQTSWHHFINISYQIEPTNMWQTQIANKPGTTNLWVRSRGGGSISNSSAWSAPWTLILTSSNFSTYAATAGHSHGLLHTDYTVTLANTTTDSGWSMLNSTYTGGFLLKSIRTQLNAPSWIEGSYAAGIAFGGADTKGVLSVGYQNPKIKIAGGNGTTPKWYITLEGTSKQIYRLDDFALTRDVVLIKSPEITSITDLQNYPSFMGSLYMGYTWYNVLSSRRHNDVSGSNAGFYLKSYLTSLGDLSWGQQYYTDQWSSEKIILDSSNYDRYALPKHGGTLTGGIIIPTSITGGNIPIAGALTLSSTTSLTTHPSYIGSVYISDTWYNMISCRHRNGASDGSSYGMYLKSYLTSAGNLIWCQQYGTGWTSEKTILDSSNYTSFAATSGHSHGIESASYAQFIDASSGNYSLFGAVQGGYTLKSIRFNTPPAWAAGWYASAIAFGGADTRGTVSVAYDYPVLTFSGGTTSAVRWIMSISGSNNVLYNLDNFLPLSGGNMTGSITINNSYGILVKNSSGTACNALHMNSSNQMVFGYGASTRLIIGNSSATQRLVLCTSGRMDFCADGQDTNGAAVSLTGRTLRPTTSGGIALGNTSYRWQIFYTVGSPNVSSDRRLKNTIEDLEDKYITLCNYLSPKSYYLNHSTQHVKQIGFVAQEVEEAAEKAGLSLQDCGFIHKDYVNRDDYQGYEYGLSYDAFGVLAIAKIKQQDQVIQELRSEIEELRNLIT